MNHPFWVELDWSFKKINKLQNNFVFIPSEINAFFRNKVFWYFQTDPSSLIAANLFTERHTFTFHQSVEEKKTDTRAQKDKQKREGEGAERVIVLGGHYCWKYGAPIFNFRTNFREHVPGTLISSAASICASSASLF